MLSVKLRSHLVFVLRVEADIRVGLVDLRDAEGLRETGVVISAAQEIRERRESVAAANGAGKRDGVVVVEKVDADADSVRALLNGQAVGAFIEPVDAGGGRAG